MRSTGGSTRHSTPSSEVAHTDPAPTAIPNRRLLPSSIGSPVRLVRGSIGVSVLSHPPIQTPASPAAIVRVPPGGDGIAATRRPLLASRRDTFPSGLIAQTAPAPTAIIGKPSLVWPSAPGSRTVRVTRVVPGSTRDTLVVWPGPVPIHNAPAPAAMSVGCPRGS